MATVTRILTHHRCLLLEFHGPDLTRNSVGAFRLNEVRIAPAATQAFTAVGLTNVTGFAISTVVNKKYLVQIWTVYNAAAVGTGLAQGYTITGTSNVWSMYTVPTSLAGASLIRHTINSGAIFAATASPATTNNVAFSEFRIETTVAGVFQYQMATEVNASAITLQTTSVMSIIEIGT